jgi:hypothetical protein
MSLIDPSPMSDIAIKDLLPLVTFLAALLGIWSVQKIAKDRMRFDQNLAREKFEFDKKLADRKRQQEIAEEILAGAYEVRAIIKGVRFPGSNSNESADRPRAAHEPLDVTRMLDTYYVPIARLKKADDRISDLLSKRYRAAALLGTEVEAQIVAFQAIIGEVVFAARMLMDDAKSFSGKMPQNATEKYREKIWSMSATPDLIDQRLDEIVSKIEAVCYPILSEGPASKPRSDRTL